MFASNHLSESGKIDAIYDMLRSEQRSRRISIFIRILLVVGLIYGYYYINLPENAAQKKQIIEITQQKFSEFISPIVSQIMQNVMGAMQNSQNGTQTNITPEMIRAVQEGMKK